MFLKYLWKNQRKKAPRPPYHKRGHPDLRKCNITQLKMLSIERPTFFLQGTPVPCQEMIKKKEDEEIGNLCVTIMPIWTSMRMRRKACARP